MMTGDVVALYDALGGGWEDNAANSGATIDQAPPPLPAALDSLGANPPR
jgi:hypothetical protein